MVHVELAIRKCIKHLKTVTVSNSKHKDGIYGLGIGTGLKTKYRCIIMPQLILTRCSVAKGRLDNMWNQQSPVLMDMCS